MLQPLQTRRPLPPAALEALVVAALALGLNCAGAVRRYWFAATVLWRVAYDGLLRPGEMLQLTRRAVRLPDDLLTIGMLAVLIIEAPNNRRRVGKRQFVLIKNGVTVDWLRWLVLPLKPGQGPFLAPERLW
ncbi:unnamed protein product [Polarella glacialis]|uniref:Uncharacterized protein n=1 Tax=Polarella glacialis TaxID=89957 RepID=A0A813JGS8_POLGL|nr:unnamed protein product [Polarella glacialis]